jgi:BirA family biotin operon repressor/biotin-[acetyl-CoA-carboxylase] ligase
MTILDSTGSTNDVLAASAAASTLPNFSAVLTLDQTAGRGRLGRVWVAPPGKTVALSVLVRPILPAGEPLSPQHFGWLPLMAGVAMAESIDALVGDGRTGLKWPNDVQIDGRKVCGILAELLESGDSVIIGSGINLDLTEDELPVPTATSFALAGVALTGDGLVDAVVAGYLSRLSLLLDEFLRVGADPGASGILEQVSERCSSLGREVRVELPGAADVLGVATSIDTSGRLVVRRTSDGVEQAVAAGDVTHLRYE